MAREVGLTLLDIGNPTIQVPVTEDQSVAVSGISTEGILNLFVRFPELQKYLGGKGVAVADLVRVAPEAIAAVIAAGTGAPGDSETEVVARKLPVETQIDILEAIMKLSFRSGFGPFVQRIVAISGQAASLNSVSTGKETPTKSPQASSDSSPADTDRKLSGNTPPAN